MMRFGSSRDVTCHTRNRVAESSLISPKNRASSKMP